MNDNPPSGGGDGTRERLLAAGIRLFADRGYRDTTVGDIEAAAGLQPRRGAMYYYFSTKQALLEAAVETHLAAIEQGRRQLDDLRGIDIRSEALSIGRWFLAELDAERYLCRILEQEGDRVPEIREMIRARIIEAGHLAVERAIRRWMGKQASPLDTGALAVLLVAPLVNLRRATWTYGSPPLGVDDKRLLGTWADSCNILAEHIVGRQGDRVDR
jgi:AcrR family transcriptional regulator